MVAGVTVGINQDPVGRLLAGPRSSYNFVYDEGAVESVSLTMPTTIPAYPHDSLHPMFAQNLPEGYLGAIVRKAVAKLYDASDLTLLAALGPHQIGRLRFSAPEVQGTNAAESRESMAEILQSKDSKLFDELLEKYCLRSGLSGVQPKVLLEATAREKATLRTGGFIVKSWGDDFPCLAANEYFCLKVAQQAGLKVPNFDLSANGKLFVMERFDITDGESFLGFEDACVLQGLSPREKYSGSYERLAKTISTFCSPALRRNSMTQLFISLAVSWAVRNGDAHLKNFGVRYQNGGAGRTLAPGFDIVSTVPYLTNDVPALTLAGKKIWWSPKLLASFARIQCQLNNREVTEVFIRLGKSLVEQTGLIEDYVRVNPEFAEVGGSMVEIFRSSAKQLGEYLDGTG